VPSSRRHGVNEIDEDDASIEADSAKSEIVARGDLQLLNRRCRIMSLQ
jgi:hypothetical protein